MNTASSTPAPAPLPSPLPNPPTLGGPCEGRNDRSKEVGHPGPVTPQGKAIAARNATTHGLFARDVVLPALGEDPAAFDALLQQLLTQLPPRHLLERHYLEQIAAASWRLRRLHRWQAQIYEDPALTEDERLDKLDKVLRHETALTRQIDRAVRMMNRDLADLFQSRARDDALYFRNVTDVECRQNDELAIDVQQLVWKQARSASPDAEIDYDRLDNTHAVPLAESQICENEPRAQTQKTQICQNEPPAAPTPSGPHPPPAPLPSGEARRGTSRGGSLPTPEWDPPSARTRAREICTPAEYIAYRKREQELYRQFHPDASNATETDWDDPEIQKAYGVL